ncbi:hypothetical protein [Pedobacter antarcticus]|uniref:hypothetical protein n=1 Tax=Pedobacter antarcticus TaxID=34086 RepID=UPI00088F855B|nr:hypothetical protein [Pedobacter antarcticus]SDM83955.1 hypothetical protein SAMN04488084_11553 [Pedobacter antarcticus]
MTNNERITHFLREESGKGNLITLNKGVSNDFRKVVYMAYSEGLLERTPGQGAYRFTKKAFDIIDDGITYDEYLKTVNNVKPWWYVWGKNFLKYIVPNLVSALLGYWLAKQKYF